MHRTIHAPGLTVEVRPSFDDFYREHVTRVMALAVALSDRREIAEELVQEAFARAFRDWDRVGRYDDPGAWVRRVMINLSHSRWRRFRRETLANARAHAAMPRPVELTEPSAELWHAVRTLPQRQAATVALHYVEDLSIARIADLLGVAEGTTKSDLHRARKQLARELGEGSSWFFGFERGHGVTVASLDQSGWPA